MYLKVYFAKRKVNKVKVELSSGTYAIQEKALKREVTSSYYKYQFAREKERIYLRLDSLYKDFAHMAKRRFELGETNYLEKISFLVMPAKSETLYISFSVLSSFSGSLVF